MLALTPSARGLKTTLEPAPTQGESPGEGGRSGALEQDLCGAGDQDPGAGRGGVGVTLGVAPDGAPVGPQGEQIAGHRAALRMASSSAILRFSAAASRRILAIRRADSRRRASAVIGATRRRDRIRAAGRS